MTPRNIRAYQTQGLLPAPERRGRTGVYGAEHVAQLEMIRDLRMQGIGLPAIERLMAWGEGIPAAELRAFASSLLQGLIEETPAIEPGIDATEIWGADQVTPELVERSLATGFFRLEDDGTFVVRSPTLRAHGAELHALGVSFADAIDLMEALHRHLDAVAVSFAELFVNQFAPPLDANSSSEERAAALKTVSERLDRLRPMATSAVNAAFRLVLQTRAEEALAETLGRARARTGRASRAGA